MGISLHTKAVPSGGTLEVGMTPNRGQSQWPGQAIDTRCDLSRTRLSHSREKECTVRSLLGVGAPPFQNATLLFIF